jgi:hypothetical protein
MFSPVPRSSWQVTMTAREVLQEKAVMIDPAYGGNLTASGYYGSPYPFGIDPVWQAGLAIKNPPKKNPPKKTHLKKTTKNVFWVFFKLLILYENNTKF